MARIAADCARLPATVGSQPNGGNAMNKPETLDPGAGMVNLRDRAAAMTEVPRSMTPDGEAARQLDTTTVRAEAVKVKEVKFPDADDAGTEPSDPGLPKVNQGK